ncbi:unnamed protein product [Lasius platythorax]|uniref:Gag-pol polyprotein n=1 Tax=Lasius platythorax TaxID=488582 RepID=A0AAV2MY64_9HYME
MSDLRLLLIEQRNLIDSINRVLINYKKLAKANVTLPKTTSRQSALEKLWEKCQALHVKILQTATKKEQKTETYFIEQEILDAKDSYIETADYLAESVSKLSKREPSPSGRCNDSSLRNASSGMQLPRITLPKFSGSFVEWENFRGIFESIVANNDSLTNTQKLHYLKSSLIGDAALLVSNIKISETNYDPAWKLLTDEYDNRNAIIHAHIHSFADLPKMKTEQASDLKRLRDNASAALAALTNMTRPVEQWSDLLVYIIFQKFSPRTRNEWNLTRGNSNEYLTYKEIHDFLTCRIRGLGDYPSHSDSVSNNSRSNKGRSSVNHVSVLKCVQCSGSQCLAKCDDFIAQSADQRRQLARQYKCCSTV